MQHSLHDMKRQDATPLAPLLRSRAHAEILAIVLLDPEREWSLTELARLVGTSVPTAQREVKRAEAAGVVRSRKVGNTRLVGAEPAGILTGPLTQLLLRSFGPKYVLQPLRDVPGVEAAFIFGSWAARYSGIQGHFPRDVDVLVIGKPDLDALDTVIADAERQLSQQIQVTIRRRSWWDKGEDSFRKEISKRPLVEVFDPSDAGSAA